MSEDYAPPFALAALAPVADAIALVFRPHAEVVVHDLASDRIVHIANAFSGRRAGDPSLTEIESLAGFDKPVIGPYPKRNFDGRRLKSVTAVVPDAAGRPVGLVCINVDVSMFEAVAAAARGFLDFGETRPAALMAGDWREEANAIIGDYLFERGLALSALSAEQRAEVVALLDARGFFSMRNAADQLARSLGVSRATLYATLKTVRAAAPATARTTP